MSASDEQERARASARGIIEQIERDPAFARRAQDDPVGTLRAAGLPDGAIGDFLREIGIEAEVAGYGKCNFSCVVSTSCWITV